MILYINENREHPVNVQTISRELVMNNLGKRQIFVRIMKDEHFDEAINYCNQYVNNDITLMQLYNEEELEEYSAHTNPVHMCRFIGICILMGCVIAILLTVGLMTGIQVINIVAIALAVACILGALVSYLVIFKYRPMKRRYYAELKAREEEAARLAAEEAAKAAKASKKTTAKKSTKKTAAKKATTKKTTAKKSTTTKKTTKAAK